MQKKAAELLRIKPTTLNEMIKRYEIGPRRKKGRAKPNDRDERPLRAPSGRQSFPATELTRE